MIPCRLHAGAIIIARMAHDATLERVFVDRERDGVGGTEIWKVPINTDILVESHPNKVAVSGM